MEGIFGFESKSTPEPKPRYEAEGISGPENELMYKNQLQKNLAQLAFPEAPVPIAAWIGDPNDPNTLAARFSEWFATPNRPHVHLDTPEALQELLAQLRGSTIH
jgi:hypothetical protein